MTIEREELAQLFAHYLQGTLNDDIHVATWERLRKSNDSTIINACQILADQIDDTGLESKLLDKSEWDYIERVRLALLGNATIVKRKTFRFGWRNVLSGFGFFAFVLLAVQYGFGYHLLPATAFLGLAIFVFSKILPEAVPDSPYHSIVYPFTSFSGLKSTHQNAVGFRKIRHVTSRKQDSFLSKCFWLVVAGFLMTILSPVMLLAFTFPDTEPKYQAIAG